MQIFQSLEKLRTDDKKSESPIFLLTNKRPEARAFEMQNCIKTVDHVSSYAQGLKERQ